MIVMILWFVWHSFGDIETAAPPLKNRLEPGPGLMPQTSFSDLEMS
jgi:hypothetical protein